MKSFVVGPVKLKIGKNMEEQVYVAPIEQDMFLGQYILYARGSAIVNMRDSTLTFCDQVLNLSMGSKTQSVQVSRVTVVKRRLAQFKCRMKEKMYSYMVEPVQGLKVLVPRIWHFICVVNTSNKYHLLKKGLQVAKAVPVEEVENNVLHAEDRVCTSSTEEPNTGSSENTEERHGTTGITDKDDRTALSTHSKGHVRFFYKVPQPIDTGDASLVKERMRRTPAARLQVLSKNPLRNGRRVRC
jgi:hypothetical protein